MQKKNLKPLILSSLAALAMAGVGTGATFALFTDKAETTINVEAGKVKIAKSVTTPALHSAKADPNGTILDEYGNKYAEQEGWVNGGTAAFDADGVLKLEKMTPGDRVSFGVGFTNESNVNILYRFVLKAANPTDYLAAGLQTKIGAQTYQGLLSYRSAWTLLAPGATPVELGDIEMYLPLTSGNIFQGLSANYILTIEAVQGNASVNDEAGAEIAQYVPQATIVDSQKKATLEYAKEEEQTASTTVELDFNGDQSAAQAGQEFSIGVVTRDFIQNAGSFVVESGEMAAAAIDLNLYVDGQAATNGFNAKVTTAIASGLTNVDLKYNGTSGAFSQGGTLVNTIDDVNEPGEYWYNAGTGALVFMTDHFSEYYVVADNIVAYNKTGTQVYTSVQEAVNQASAYDSVVVLSDVTSDARVNLSKSMVLEGDPKKEFTKIKVNNKDNRALDISDTTGSQVFTLRHLDLDASEGKIDSGYNRGVSMYGNEDITLNIDHSKIESSYYAINVAGANKKVAINIEDSSVAAGWAGLNVWSKSTLNVKDSVLSGTNDKTYNADGWNNFGTVVMNRQDAAPGTAESVLNFENTTIIGKTVNGNRQALLDLRDDYITCVFKDCTFVSEGIPNEQFGDLLFLFRAHENISFINCTFIKDGEKLTTIDEIVSHFGFYQDPATSVIKIDDVTLDFSAPSTED